MSDIIFESIRTVLICLILLYIWKIGHVRGFNSHKGWSFIISGGCLVLMGSVLDITDNFPGLNALIIVGDTEIKAFLEKFVGFLVGYALLFIGLLRWFSAGARKMGNMKQAVISTVSHELRTPLTSIYGSIKLVTDGTMGEISPKAKDTLNIALRNAERLTNIVNDILDIEKLQSGRMDFRLKCQEIYPLLNDSIEATRHYGEKYQINYELAQDSASAIADVDSERFIQIMNNLLSNAAKFSPPNSTVNITVCKQAGRVRVSVKDTGIGIDSIFAPLIFKKYTQAMNADKRHLGGIGLGLAICKGFIEEMGGTIRFQANRGIGTTFYIELPEVPLENAT